ncbi:MAG: aminopeptidase [bacterium]
MADIVFAKGAHKIVTVCGKVKPGEKVVVVTDYHKMDMAEAVAAAALQQGAEVVITTMEPRKVHNEELPAAMAAAMKEADVIIAPTTWSIAHTAARVEATKRGARTVNMPAYERQTLISGGIDCDFEAIAPMVRKMSDLLTQAKVARVTTDLGTDITLGLEGRDGAALVGMAHEPGSFATIPDVEARITPLEGTANGVMYVDAAIPLPEIGLINEPIKVTVKDGNAVKIEGGKEARIFREALEAANDPLVYNIAELGIGMNPDARLIGVMVEDEGTWGTIHIAVGTNAAFGGTVRTSLHLDMMMLNPVLELDGKVVLDRGKFLI